MNTESASFKIPKPSHVRTILKFSLGAILFWVFEFSLQYFWYAPGELGGSLIPSFAFTGATLIGVVLFSSAVFKWYPRTAQYWRLRRYLGVWGTVFIACHALSVLIINFQFRLGDLYYSFNPFANPIIFGSFAFFILGIMALTSSDWAMDVLTPKIWKYIHRCIYVGYPAAILHFLLMAPDEMRTLPGYILLTVTVAALFGQLYWFFKISARRKFKSLGFFIGMGIIILVIIFFGYAFK